MPANYSYIISSAFGLEKMTKTELTRLGYEILSVENGNIEIKSNINALADLNINLRTAERVYIRLKKFKALSFDELYDGLFSINWEEYLAEDTVFPVLAKSVKSQLFSKSDIQSISKKAIVNKLSEDYGVKVFPETAETVEIHVNLLNDEVSVLLDTSGEGLHKRGYRLNRGDAPIKETLAAGIVMLSDWRYNKAFLDPFCGSGTLAIEAAMIGMDIAPGLMRKFSCEKWIFVPQDLFKKARQAARKRIRNDIKLNIKAFDKDDKAIEFAKLNAEEAGVIDNIDFLKLDVRDLELESFGGTIVCNPPYGERLSDKKEVLELYSALGEVVLDTDNWSAYVLSSNEEFESAFGDRADRKRKLYNGNIKCYLYQYHSLV